jgi:hypothetical protein
MPPKTPKIILELFQKARNSKKHVLELFEKAPKIFWGFLGVFWVRDKSPCANGFDTFRDISHFFGDKSLKTEK